MSKREFIEHLVISFCCGNLCEPGYGILGMQSWKSDSAARLLPDIMVSQNSAIGGDLQQEGAFLSDRCHYGLLQLLLYWKNAWSASYFSSEKQIGRYCPMFLIVIISLAAEVLWL